MPSKYVVKTYVEGGIYHAYNRGVEKRDIFLDKKDYKTFLNCLKTSLTPPLDPKNLKKDFTLKGLDQTQRIQLWKQCIAESQRLGDEFLELVEKQNFAEVMQTL